MNLVLILIGLAGLVGLRLSAQARHQADIADIAARLDNANDLLEAAVRSVPKTKSSMSYRIEFQGATAASWQVARALDDHVRACPTGGSFEGDWTHDTGYMTVTPSAGETKQYLFCGDMPAIEVGEEASIYPSTRSWLAKDSEDERSPILYDVALNPGTEPRVQTVN